ncbi:ABC transporter permease [Conexibacter sp. SYSU D00693]|uniref:ABC transporter permease n=1 Tax=Conexibacter sp. SYSU D00693 TaxID=2812560 RepID=UPI00196BA5E7|nr:ABC transporter permease [Conexibacter sp. SYSU D00693]
MTGAPVPFVATVRAEWTKAATLRSTAVVATVAVLGSIALTVLLSVVVGATHDDWSAADRADYDPLLYSLTGGLVSGVALTVFGVSVMAGEFATGNIRATLVATPDRRRVLVAKGLVVAAFTGAVGTVAAVAMVVVGQLVLGAYDLETADLLTAGALRATLLSGLLTFVFPVLGVAAAAVTRSTAGGVGVLLALLFGPLVLGSVGAIPSSLEDVLDLLPAPAGDAIAIGHLDEGGDHLAAGLAVPVLAGWLVLAFALAAVVLERRDV